MIANSSQKLETLDDFIKKRRIYWKLLEEITKRLSRIHQEPPTVTDMKQFGQLYRLAVADLSYSRSIAPDSPVVRYLNDLVSTAYQVIYFEERPSILRIFYLFIKEFPPLLKKYAHYIIVSSLIFFAAFILGHLTLSYHSRISELFYPKEIREILTCTSVMHGSPVSFTPEEKAWLSATIMTNNIEVAFLAFTSGIFLGIGTVLVLLHNGLLLGILASINLEYGDYLDFWSLILPHGFLELFAIFVSAGAGLLIAHGILVPGPMSRLDSFVSSMKDGVKLIGGTAVFLVLAAIIEGFFTPAFFPPLFKLFFAFLTLAGLLIFIYLSPESEVTPSCEQSVCNSRHEPLLLPVNKEPGAMEL